MVVSRFGHAVDHATMTVGQASRALANAYPLAMPQAATSRAADHTHLLGTVPLSEGNEVGWRQSVSAEASMLRTGQAALLRAKNVSTISSRI